jgi:hypothetical protein
LAEGVSLIDGRSWRRGCRRRSVDIELQITAGGHSARPAEQRRAATRSHGGAVVTPIDRTSAKRISTFLAEAVGQRAAGLLAGVPRSGVDR